MTTDNKTALRSPLYPFALTVDDVHLGVSFIRCVLGWSPIKEDVFASKPFVRGVDATGRKILAVHTEDISQVDFPQGLSLAYMGITQHQSSAGLYWDTRHFVVANTAESRRQLVEWLSQQKNASCRELLDQLKLKYPE